MSDAVTSLLVGGVFGLALAAPPGPMNAVIAEESVIRGWVAGFKAGLGAMTADACFFFLALIGVVGFVGTMPRLRAAMIGAGGLLMLWFAASAVHDVSAFTTAAGPGPGQAVPADGKGFWKALVLALTNPYQIVFWLTVGVGLLQPGSVDVLAHAPYAGASLSGLLVVETGSPALVVGFFSGIVLWIMAFPASLVSAGRHVDRFAPAVAVASAAVLALFGLWFLGDAVRSLL